MVVKNQIKFIKSLHQKKYRTQHGLFVAEGVKLIGELLDSDISPKELYATDEYTDARTDVPIHRISNSELVRMSSLKSPNKVLGVFYIPTPEPLDFSGWILALDRVQDPGNLGTIIRLCDWFGIGHLLCSTDTADCYNPKVLQATMGSIARVNVVYGSVESVLRECGLPTYGASVEGQSVYDLDLPDSGILVMGNESSGISAGITNLLDFAVAIPSYSGSKAESLNVATATAVLLSEIRRNTIQK